MDSQSCSIENLLRDLGSVHVVINADKFELVPKNGITQDQIDEITQKANLAKLEADRLRELGELASNISPEELKNIFSSDPADFCKPSEEFMKAVQQYKESRKLE